MTVGKIILQMEIFRFAHKILHCLITEKTSRIMRKLCDTSTREGDNLLEIISPSVDILGLYFKPLTLGAKSWLKESLRRHASQSLRITKSVEIGKLGYQLFRFNISQEISQYQFLV